MLARHVFSGREAKMNKYMGGSRWVVSANETKEKVIPVGKCLLRPPKPKVRLLGDGSI